MCVCVCVSPLPPPPSPSPHQPSHAFHPVVRPCRRIPTPAPSLALKWRRGLKPMFSRLVRSFQTTRRTNLVRFCFCADICRLASSLVKRRLICPGDGIQMRIPTRQSSIFSPSSSNCLYLHASGGRWLERAVWFILIERETFVCESSRDGVSGCCSRLIGGSFFFFFPPSRKVPGTRQSPSNVLCQRAELRNE